MPTPVLVLIALTVLACGFIVALLLKIRSQHIAAQPVFGSYGGIDRAESPFWQTRNYRDGLQSPGILGGPVAGAYQPESEAKDQVGEVPK